MLKKIFLALGFLLIACGLSLALLYYYYIVMYPGEQISPEYIQKTFATESPVYYDDGKSVIGVFFQKEHRKYVKFEDLPKDFVNAIIAAEDKNFYHHPGFDPIGILRAIWLNLKQRRLSHGGSTITQQAAKNIFKREKRTIGAKLRELIHALKLEAHYSKNQILEWYVNQFYVNSNGRGIGVAAEYFFNKEPKDLNLVESAFIAGSLKAPSRYNPFIKKTEEEKRRAKLLATSRRNYVLKNMLELGMISRERYEEALSTPIPFNQGKISYPINVILDHVRERLESSDIRDSLEALGIDNVGSSGIRIYTTINREIQEDALEALRKNLSVLETKLSGYDREKIQQRYEKILSSGEETIQEEGWSFGKVLRVVQSIEAPLIEVELPQKRRGIIDREGLSSIAGALAQFRRGIWARASDKDLGELLKQIKVSDTVFVRIRGEDPVKGRLLLDLMQYPEINGAVIVLHKGQIKAMVGGFNNYYFNRALDAKRQVGSIFKPLVFLAALQLGWSNLDLLDNRRSVFSLGNEIYVPRPDHRSPYQKVSLEWAGVKSENVAAVWLLNHLCDRLNPAQFREVAALVGMAPARDEGYKAYARRIRDRFGLLMSRKSLERIAFDEAKKELMADLILEGAMKEAESLELLKYGEGFGERLEEYKAKELTKEEREEIPLLLWNYQRLKALAQAARSQYSELLRSLQDGEGLTSAASRFFIFRPRKGQTRLVYAPHGDLPGLEPLDYVELLIRNKEGAAGQGAKVVPFDPEQIWLDNKLRLGIIDELSEIMNEKLERLKRFRLYDFELLSRFQDFRTLVGLRYLIMLARTLGIESRLDPVLSFPLGANSVSLLDIAKAYSAFLGGNIYVPERSRKLKNHASIISRIASPEGEILYQSKVVPYKAVNPRLSFIISDILRNVILNGTGAGARGKVRLSHPDSKLRAMVENLSIKIPGFGKTGTSNEYRNSSFIGFIPGFDSKNQQVSLEEGYIIAVYVGYDDNKPMKNRHVRIFGASGALPIWIEVANGIAGGSLYTRNIDLIDLSFQPGTTISVNAAKGAKGIWVEKGSGIYRPLSAGSEDLPGKAMVYSFGHFKDGEFIPERWFLPIRNGGRWMQPEAADTERAEKAAENRGIS